MSVVGSRQGVSIIHDREMTTMHDRGVSMSGAGHNAPLVAGHNAPLMAGHYAPITGHNASLMMNHQSFNSELSSEDQGYADLLSDQRLLGGISKVQPVGANNAAAAHGPMKYSAFNHQQQHQVAPAAAYDSYHSRESTQLYYGKYTTKFSSLQ